MPDKNKPTETNIVDIVTSELTYLPSVPQRKLKSAFWSRFNENPLCDPSQISLSIALRFVPDGRLEKWWQQVGFREWFCNHNEFRDRLEYLSHKILDSLEYVLDDPKAQASAKVNAAKLILEASRKMPSRTQKETMIDERVAQMDKKQLQEFIERQVQLRLPGPKSGSDSN